ncbi:unnamed protein product [Schistocephalus solidus]|uniref:Uncharacterized protein n=1 Tax=Schistocephalus solidus TaxID=70667 RepID=A0A183SJ58_SCHSO|nr:unnamed protein product [Schistocephalus solidus]
MCDHNEDSLEPSPHRWYWGGGDVGGSRWQVVGGGYWGGQGGASGAHCRDQRRGWRREDDVVDRGWRGNDEVVVTGWGGHRRRRGVAAQSQLHLPQHGVDAEDSGPLQDFRVRDPVLPSQLQHSVEAAEMKSLTLGPSSGLKSEPHLGDDEVVIRPNIGIADCLGHQHVLSISPPDEEIIQQLPAPLPRVHPRGLLLRRNAEEGVGQQETVFRTGSQKEETGFVTATETVGTQHSLPGSVVCSDEGVEVTKDN